MTALFADIKGSTELIEHLDPEEARAIIDPALHAMIAAVRAHDGHVVQSTGDGIFALFGAPVAVEDHPQRALFAALAMQQALRAYADTLEARGRQRINVRVGVHTGEAVMRPVETSNHREYTPVGLTTHLAARLQEVAPAGSIAISESTRCLVDGYFKLRPVGPVRLKGVSDPIAVYEVTGAERVRTRFQRAASRGLTRFVGRQPELDKMRRLLDAAIKGHGQVVAVTGDPGTGKSRLVHEFKGSLPDSCKLLGTYCFWKNRASAYQPILELLQDYFGFDSGDDSTLRREKVRAVLAALDPALSDTQPYVFALLGIAENPDPLAQTDPQVRRRRILGAVRQILLREAIDQPLCVVFEDLHWIDQESQALLDLLVESIEAAPLLLVINYRPEYSHHWEKQPYYSQIGIDPLNPDAADEMLTVLTGAERLQASLKRTIIEKTEGNPCFIEEIVQALTEQGLIGRDRITAHEPAGELRIPPTVQGVLASRIDRLPPDQKELLQTLAVIGNQFPVRLAGDIAGRNAEELERMLAGLERAEFIRPQEATPNLEYRFRHPLTHDVAYNSILMERRKVLHGLTAQAMEATFRDRLDEHLDALADHFTRSANAPKAVHYLQLAAVQSAQRSALAQAVSYLNSALKQLPQISDEHVRSQSGTVIQTGLGEILMVVKGPAHPDVGAAFSRATELCRVTGDDQRLCASLRGLRLFHSMRAEFNQARAVADQLLSLGARTEDPAVLGIAHTETLQALIALGEFREGIEHAQRALKLQFQVPATSRVFGGHPRLVALSWTAWGLWCLGYPDQARSRSDEALAMALELQRPTSLALCRLIRAQCFHLLRNVEEVREQAEQTIALAEEHALPYHFAVACILREWSRAKQSGINKAISETSRALDNLKATGVHPRFIELAPLLDIICQSDSPEPGIEIIERALSEAQSTGEGWGKAELHRSLGELLLKTGGGSESRASDHLVQAILIARQQRSRSWELRAARSLARLLIRQAKSEEAYRMLAPIYESFTEGFDTADLIEARAILNAGGE